MEAFNLERVKQLHADRRLIAIGAGSAFLINWVIGPILTQLGAADQHLGKLIAAGQSHFAECNITLRSSGRQAAGSRSFIVEENLATQSRGETVGPAP